MAKLTNWMPLRELELMEERMRRLLEKPKPVVDRPPASAARATPDKESPLPVRGNGFRAAPARDEVSNSSFTPSKGEPVFTTHQPADALIEALRREHVSYELVPHQRTETAMAEAKTLHVDPHQVAKTLILTTPFGYVRAVLRAVDRLDLKKARFALDTPEVELENEGDLVGAYPEFELGAVPPVGGPYDRVLVDQRVFNSTFILLEAGTHDESIRLRASELLSIAEAEVVDLAQDDPRGQDGER
jgi:Ala-tRNA(Pro) deacylase